jgi:hypothetical protein
MIFLQWLLQPEFFENDFNIPFQKTHFADFKKVRVIGGSGGHGMMCFTSEKFKEWNGPDGGDGGCGGHVIFKGHLSNFIRA